MGQLPIGHECRHLVLVVRLAAVEALHAARCARAASGCAPGSRGLGCGLVRGAPRLQARFAQSHNAHESQVCPCSMSGHARNSAMSKGAAEIPLQAHVPKARHVQHASRGKRTVLGSSGACWYTPYPSPPPSACAAAGARPVSRAPRAIGLRAATAPALRAGLPPPAACC